MEHEQESTPIEKAWARYVEIHHLSKYDILTRGVFMSGAAAMATIITQPIIHIHTGAKDFPNE